MKKTILALLFLLATVTVACAEMKDFDEGYVKLLDTHCIRTFVEGTPVGDEFIMGARGSIHFIYLSGTMSEMIAKSQEAPAWLTSANNDMGFGKRGYENYIIYLVANQPWVVEAEKFNIGGYHLKREDILTGFVKIEECDKCKAVLTALKEKVDAVSYDEITGNFVANKNGKAMITATYNAEAGVNNANL